MGNLVFQATLGGQVNLVGPNTASTFNLNVPAVSSTIASLAAQTFAGTQTFTLDAVVNGLTVGKGGGAVSTNTALGYQALNGNSSGVGLFVAGYQAGLVTTGSYSTFTGYQAGKANTSGENTAYGANALLQNTTGTANTALGGTTTSISGALASNTTGGSNVGVGVGALSANTTASNNTAVGYQSLYANTTGHGTAVGHRVLYSNTTGDGNTGVGGNDGSVGSALLSNTTGNYNIAVGTGALLSNTTASNNTAVGYQAGYSGVTAPRNTSIGYKAGYANTTGYNCFIGTTSGTASTGYGNTFVGSDYANGCGALVTSGNNNTILGGYSGNQGGLDIRTSSNNIVLSDGDGNPWVVVNSGGSMVLGGNGYSYDASPYQATEGFIVGLNDATRYGAIFGCNSIANREAVVLVNPNGAVGSIRTNGSATTFNTSSDYRLKENIAPMTGALAKVSQLKPVTYKWKIDGTDGEGFIAHELAEVCPSAVSGEKDAVDKNGKIKPQGIDVSFLVATLTAAIQELKAEFDAYKATHP